MINIFFSALKSILIHKKQALLSTVGIFIGIFAVIVIVNFTSSSKQKLEDELDKFGKNIITISAQLPTHNPHRHKITKTLTIGNADTIKTRLSQEIKNISMDIQNGVFNVSTPSSTITTEVIGVTPSYFSMRKFKLKFGRLFNYLEENGASNVAVVGSDIYKQLLKSGNYTTITIGTTPFKIIGVLTSMGVNLSNTNLDDMVYVPLSTARVKLYHADYISDIYIQSAYNIKNNIADILLKAHNIKNPKFADFTITTNEELIKTKMKATDLLSILMVVVAAISLIVGGIGVMGMMFVMIEKRKEEIVIRRSFGATKGAVSIQFLIESIIVCFIGGGLGILFGEICSLVLFHFAHMPVNLSLNAVLIAFSSVFIVGISSGFLPAYKAASFEIVSILQ